MRTYMHDDLVCCQIHEEACSDSEFKLDVFSYPGGMTGFIMKRKLWLFRSVPTFFNFWGQFNDSAAGLLLMRSTLTFIVKWIFTFMG